MPPLAAAAQLSATFLLTRGRGLTYSIAAAAATAAHFQTSAPSTSAPDAPPHTRRHQPRPSPAAAAAAASVAGQSGLWVFPLLPSGGRSCHTAAQPVAEPRSAQLKCWSCHAPRSYSADVVCRECSKLQPPDDGLDHYQLLGLPSAHFDVDGPTLDKQYKKLQWQVHPDRAAGSSGVEQEYAAEHASRANTAYSVLRAPLARAKYLLHLWGLSGGVVDGEGTIEDPELLMEVMEAREEVEGCDDQAGLHRLLDSNRKAQARVLARLSTALREHCDSCGSDSVSAPAATATAQEGGGGSSGGGGGGGGNGGVAPSPGGTAARQCVVELTYLTKLDEEIVKKVTHL